MVKQSRVVLIFSTLFIDVAAMGMLIPVLPELLRGFVDGDFGRAAQLSVLLVDGAGARLEPAPELAGLPAADAETAAAVRALMLAAP